MRAPLTAEINDPASPVRRFLDERFTVGLREVQRRYRETLPPLAVPAAPASCSADPGTLSTAAQWLLRFLLRAQPDLSCAVRGARLFALTGVDVTPALTDLADRLAVPMPGHGDSVRIFPGPAPATHVDPDLLARACWALALLTEVARGVPFVSRFAPTTPTGDDLLALAPPAALYQLFALHEVFAQTLIPRLGLRTGPWALGASFTGSQLTADADVIAAGLLLEVTTSANEPTLDSAAVFRLIGRVLLDFDDAYRFDSLGHFSARHRHLVTWQLDVLLAELAGTLVHLPTLREQFRELLSSHRHR
jgi:hypothetical protein